MILIARSDNKYSYTVDMHSSIVNNESLYVAFTQKKTDTWLNRHPPYRYNILFLI